MDKIQYNLDVVDDGTIVLIFHKSDFDLSFKFLSNGKTEILSLEKSNLSTHNPKETMCYVLQGNFSSSSLVEKSYKINRVLSMLDYDDEAVVITGESINDKTTSIMDSLKTDNGECNSFDSLNLNEKSKKQFSTLFTFFKTILG